MSKRIEKLTIKDFRGATVPVDIDFDKSKPMTMIFGENGTGKSSIVDAFDFVCNQNYGSIDGRSSVKKKAHLPAIGKSKNDITITLKFDDKKWTAKHLGADPVTSPNGFPLANILRRSNILKLIDAAPNKRYEALSEFLAVPNIEKCENTLRNAIRSQERESHDSFQSVQQAKEELESLQIELKEDNKPTEEWSKEVAEINEDDLKTIINNAKEIETLQEKYLNAKTEVDETKKSLEGSILVETKALTELKNFQDQEVSKEDLQKLLKTAKEYFTQNANINTCPVCEQDINSSDVLKRLRQRLEDMATLTKLMNAVSEAKTNKSNAEQIFKTRENDYKKCVSELVSKIKNLNGRDVDVDKGTIDYEKLITELTDADSKDIENAKNELAKYEKYKQYLLLQKSGAEKKQQQQAAVKSLLESIKQKEAKRKIDAALLERLNQYEEIVPAIRKQFTDNILATVSNEVERLYQTIHPDEGLGGIKLYLKPNVRGSLEYDGKFQGLSNIPPQAYYSDAHLDTLGICMFLALAKHFNDDNTLIVLDDVVTSADESHRERFLNLLHDEADNFCHMVVTTHYRPWRDFYRIGGGPSNKVQFVDLQLWSKETGIRHTKSKLIIDELRLLKENITVENRQEIASKSGILLEGILDQLALIYKLKVPRQPLQRYELKSLFDSLAKRKKHIKTIQKTTEIDIEMELKTVIEPLENMNEVRNKVGCHWNIDGSLFSDSKIKDFAEKTIALCESLICSECGNLPTRSKQIENYYQCQCGKKLMLPLTIP